MRGLLMLLVSLAFHLASAPLLGIALVLFVTCALDRVTNERLSQLGTSIGQYLRQITEFVSFAVEVVPFPFEDWPSAK
jgi:hypothetical protein